MALDSLPPGVDLSKIPEEYDGLWIVVRKSDQAILGSGKSLEEAIGASGAHSDDSGVVVTRAPVDPPVREYGTE